MRVLLKCNLAGKLQFTALLLQKYHRAWLNILLSSYQGSILLECSSRLLTIQTRHRVRAFHCLAPKWLVPTPTTIVFSGLIPGRPRVSQLANRLIVQCGMLKIRVTISWVGRLAKQRRRREGEKKGNTKTQMEERAVFQQAREGKQEGPGCEQLP